MGEALEGFRSAKAIHQDYMENATQLGNVEYQIRIFEEEKEALIERMRVINQEGSARNKAVEDRNKEQESNEGESNADSRI